MHAALYPKKIARHRLFYRWPLDRRGKGEDCHTCSHHAAMLAKNRDRTISVLRGEPGGYIDFNTRSSALLVIVVQLLILLCRPLQGAPLRTLTGGVAAQGEGDVASRPSGRPGRRKDHVFPSFGIAEVAVLHFEVVFKQRQDGSATIVKPFMTRLSAVRETSVAHPRLRPPQLSR